jgi:hypothetical protein
VKLEASLEQPGPSVPTPPVKVMFGQTIQRPPVAPPPVAKRTILPEFKHIPRPAQVLDCQPLELPRFITHTAVKVRLSHSSVVASEKLLSAGPVDKLSKILLMFLRMVNVFSTYWNMFKLRRDEFSIDIQGL